MIHQTQYRTVIVANGTFPSHSIPLDILRNAERIIACDGSTQKLINHGFEPNVIVGDLDSLADQYKEIYKDRIYHFPSQEDNDLTKAVNWCTNQGIDQLAIIGATGEREDHTLGNIFLLPNYAKQLNVTMFTDHGYFVPLLSSQGINCTPGQQISIFSTHPDNIISSSGLKYPIIRRPLSQLWMGTLNECEADKFTLDFSPHPLIVFLQYQ
ncbi:thiamine diphosphokinase [Puteibacter caeruleilacunae]|nr:thiamine diphosphokinase [Puteibacter caeruleilacunae]